MKPKHTIQTLLFIFLICTVPLQAQELYTQSNAAHPTNESNATTGWVAANGGTTVTSDATEAYSGTHSIKIEATSDGWRRASYTFNTKIGAQYSISIYAKSASTEGPGFYQWTGFGDFQSQGITSTDWTEYTFNFTAVESSASILVYTGNPSLTGNAVYIDNISIVESMPSPVSLPLYINVGGPQLTHNDGTVFAADEYFLGGAAYTNSSALVSSLYQSERYASSKNIYYNMGVPNGNYRVTLHFAEIYYGATGGESGGVGTRIFDVNIEGILVLDNYDIIADVGSETEVAKTFDVTVNDGVMNFHLTSETADGGSNNPKLSAIEVVDLSTIETEAPTQPQVSYSTTDTTISLSWSSTDNVAVTGYNLSINGGNPVTLTPPNSTSYQFTGLTANTAYQIAINAYDDAGNNSLYTYLTLTTDGSSGSSGGGTVSSSWLDVVSSTNIYYNDGNVGIGTTDPGTWKLAVNGNIRSKEIKVESDWADYVFDKNYDLPTLEEVEHHIKEKGHLMNIPSASEVARDGILLGDINKRLLEKIEELTLYVIQQNKQIQDLNSKVEQQQDQIKRLLEETTKN